MPERSRLYIGRLRELDSPGRLGRRGEYLAQEIPVIAARSDAAEHDRVGRACCRRNVAGPAMERCIAHERERDRLLCIRIDAIVLQGPHDNVWKGLRQHTQQSWITCASATHHHL